MIMITEEQRYHNTSSISIFSANAFMHAQSTNGNKTVVDSYFI